MSGVYFNEHDAFAAQWLRNLYPDAIVDERSIHDVQPGELVRERVHFFGGIGGWQYALDLAGWCGPVWTGSCPCQPYSAAGKQKGDADERNLWPEMFRLIRECRPPVVFGEQVESAIRHGWLDGICRDLEGEGYAVGAHVLGAHSVGAPHIRQRLFWVAVTPGSGHRRTTASKGKNKRSSKGHEPAGELSSGFEGYASDFERLEHATLNGRQQGRPEPDGRDADSGCDAERVDDAEHGRTPEQATRPESRHGSGDACGMVQPQSDGLETGLHLRGPCEGEHLADAGRASIGDCAEYEWRYFQTIPCADSRARRISSQPGDEPLAHGIPIKRDDPRLGYIIAKLVELGHSAKAARRMVAEARSNRTGRLRGYGNAIVPQVAAEFIRAVMEIT